MTNLESVITHITKGTTYSWDLTVLLGLGITIPAALRSKLLQSKTSAEEAEWVRSAYTGQQLSHWRR